MHYIIRERPQTQARVVRNTDKKYRNSNTNTFSNATHTHPFNGPFSGTTRVCWYQKGKTNLDLLKQETVSGSGISWAICKSAPRSRQITTPTPHHSVFTGRMLFLPPNQQRQSTEGTLLPILIPAKSSLLS